MHPSWSLASDGTALALLVSGPVGTDDVAAIFEACGAAHERGARRFVIDLSDMAEDDLRFAAAQVTRGALARVVVDATVDVALLPPPGLAGALVLGAVHDVAVRVVAAREVPGLFVALDARAASQRWHVALRRLLLADPRQSARALAVALGLSERNLQRRLDAVGSAFRGERARARIELAIEMLTASHDKVSAIARATGFASESQFCRAFRAHTGTRPMALREVGA